MRALGLTAVLALSLGIGGVATGVAVADDHTPSRHDVQEARVAVQAKADDVDSVRARLVLANQRLQQSAVVAAQASEAYNGARWRAAEARKAAAAAQRRSAIAESDVQRQREAYGDAIVTSYEMAPGLTALSAIVRSDGIDTVIQRTVSMGNAEDALDGNYDEFRAAATLADVASDQADDAEDAAVKAQQDALDAKQQAQDAADAAAAQATAIADEKAALIAQLADLQHISVKLAQRRQSHLEQQAAAAAAAAAEQEQEQQAPEPVSSPTPQPTPDPHPSSDPEPTQSPDPTDPPEPKPTTPSTPPAPPAPPAPSGPAAGAGAAIAFARAQIGEPYRWGASGPSAWDCSGLTMGAWRAGGTSLPHYSVAQYEQSTPIAASTLQPGDLVFWGSSSDPSSIYHVALYVGGGMIIEAPRTGVPVRESSMYSWTAPNFYARP
ncbi:NlpC/P60 family protein [Nocardioides sp. CN2-186]|uniref:C40 family peptidase n=1 Tax=Nocardioides tweenelious TaxID=3156607 RepID=UPI0032B560D1